MNYDYDLFVIGAGPGGLSAAKRAATYGAKVAIAESSHLGGTCVNLGCVPKKLMVYAADFARLAAAAKDYGWTQETPQFSWQRFKQARDQHLDRLRHGQQTSLEKKGIKIIRGTATLTDAHTIAVDHQKFTADKILIAVGGKAIKPEIPGIEHTLISDAIFGLEELPKRLVVIGGGYIGAEFSSVMRGFGVEVSLMNREECLLTGFDHLISDTVRQGLHDRGIQTYCGTTAESVDRVGNELQVKLKGNHSHTLTADVVLCAIGRSPNLDALGLESVGIERHGTAIAVDKFSQTNLSNVYAVGDCTNRIQLTPVAGAEAEAFANTVFNHQPTSIEGAMIPSAVCTHPEAAAVGMTEAAAREEFGDRIKCYQTKFTPLFYALTEQKFQSVMKYVTDNDRVIGIHLVGDHSAEIIQGFELAMKKGITKAEIDSTIAIHPTIAEELFSID
ncbi:MAG TPA: glutathione-disulfide reductase [Leptolyngbya sp.]|jgi:glutathione reductase (NADPH)|nr:glutathione-disulfide reductase [Leptolyngbya sp.]